jgi:hypothetical protein
MNIWSKLGISVALVATFCVVMLEVFQDKSYYDSYKWYGCGVFLVSGIVLTFVGRALNGARRRRYLEMRSNDAEEAQTKEEEDDGTDPSQPFLLANLAYWGVMLITFGVIVVFIVPTYNKHATVVAREPQKTNAPAPATNKPVAVVTNTPPPAQPPMIKLQGLVFRKPDASVLINGRTYFIGDTFQEAELVQIDPKSAIFTWHGQRIVVAAPD